MTGVADLGGRSVGDGGAPLGSALDALGLTVTPENVLEVRKVLLAEADRLWRGLDVEGRRCRVDLCGGDPVSYDAMHAFNHRIEAFLDTVRARVQSLRNAAEVLADAARRYGRTEEQVSRSFTSAYPDLDVWRRA
jgi:hypothetical protein